MWIDPPNARLELSARHPLRLDDARGTLLRAVQGTLWITLDDDPRDIVLDAGEQFVVDSGARLLVLPLSGVATVDVQDAPAGRTQVAASRRIMPSRSKAPTAALRESGTWAKWRQVLAFS